MNGFFLRPAQPERLAQAEAALRARLEGVNHGYAAKVCILFDRLSVQPDLMISVKVSVAKRLIKISERLCGYRHEPFSRRGEQVILRRAVMGVLYAHFGLSLPAIARRMGCDHSTVLYGLQNLGLWLFEDRLTMEEFARRARERREQHLGLCAVKLCGWQVVPYGFAEAG